jgi:hypothetical protein
MASTLLTNDYLTEIGRITANFAILESALSDAIIFLLGLDERDGKIATAELSFRNKTHLIDSLYRERISDEGLIQALKEALRVAAQAEEKRNVITHSIWGIDPDTNEVVRIKRTAKLGGLKEQGEVTTTYQLRDIADDIDLAERHFTRFMKESFPAA